MEDDKVETVFPLPLWFVMLAFVICWPLAGCGKSNVGVYDDGNGNRAVFYDEPCTKESVTKLVPAPARNMLKNADGIYEGKPYDLCYAEVPPGSGDVMLIWEDGGMGVLRGAIKRV